MRNGLITRRPSDAAVQRRDAALKQPASVIILRSQDAANAEQPI